MFKKITVCAILISLSIHGSEKDESAVEKYTTLGKSFLEAVQNNDLRQVKITLLQGADIDYQDEATGNTALHFISDRNIIDFLKTKGINTSIKNNDGLNCGQYFGRQMTLISARQRAVEEEMEKIINKFGDQLPK